ncbi:MAG: YcaO-like family protein, partial [Dehalococcoidia bacterium]
HAERMTLPLKLGSFEELRYTHRLTDVDRLPRTGNGIYHAELPLLWVEGFDLLQREPVWVPYELVHTNYTLPHPTGSGCFAPSSNGLASGNHLAEAVSHAICEVVERDATTLWNLLPDMAQRATRIDPATIDDANCAAVLDCYERAGVAAGIWETTTDIGIPAFYCIISERGEDPLHPLHSAAGMGCHPVREVALLRALTEAAQSRLTIIAGSRDDIFRSDYERSRGPDMLARDRALLQLHDDMRHFRDGPTFAGETFNEDIAWELERLQQAGVSSVVLVDLTRREFGIPVARIVIPGVEGPSDLSGYVHGARGQARLEALA